MPIFTPQYIGTINERARLACLGVAYGVDNHLVFVSAHGAATHIEQFDAELRGRGSYVTVQPDSNLRLRRQSGYAHRTEHSGYVVRKGAVPSSTDISLVAFHSSVNADEVDTDRPFSYLVFETESDLEVRLWHRVHQLVNIPMQRSAEVRKFLLTRGQMTNSGVQGLPMVRKSRTAEEAANDPSGNLFWQAWGIRVATVSNNRDAWERMIATAIKDKVIPL